MTTKEAKSKLKSVHSYIALLSGYKNNKTPLQCKCTHCSFKWRPLWDSLINGRGCPRCTNNYRIKLSTTQVKARLSQISPTIRVVGEYTGTHHPLPCECKQCGHSWSPHWNSLNQGVGCPNCAGTVKLTTSLVRARLTELNPHIKLLSAYKGAKFPITCQCMKCYHVWKPLWHSLYSQGTGCPKCSSRYGIFEELVISTAEKLTGWKFPKATPKEVPFLHGLHLDGYNKERKIALEADGEQHKQFSQHFHKTRSEFVATKRRDRRKRIQCWRHGIKLIRIPISTKDIEAFLSRRLAVSHF